MRWVALLLLVGACNKNEQADKAPPPPASSAGPFYHEDVAPVLAAKCGSCHNPKGLAPFSVFDYETAAAFSSAMVDAVQDDRMPPSFRAVETDECQMDVWFKNDHRMTDKELQLLTDWDLADTPEGDPEAGASLEPPQPDDIKNPDAVVTFQKPYTVRGTEDIYRCFQVEVPHTQDVWLERVQVLPDNHDVVHHVLVWSDPNGLSDAKVGPDGDYPCTGEPGFYPTELVGAWTPGAPPTETPPGTGVKLKAGAKLVVNVHYHPDSSTRRHGKNKGPWVDQTQVALQWTTVQPAEFATWFLVDIPFGARVAPSNTGETDFRIPVGEANHEETVVLDVPSLVPFDLPIFAVMPHMHYRGTDMKVSILDGAAEECLIQVEGYRFDFQSLYAYDADRDEFPVVKAGQSVAVRCTYDNTRQNRFMDEALAAAGETDLYPVEWGLTTGDEMCMALVGIITPPVDISSFFP